MTDNTKIGSGSDYGSQPIHGGLSGQPAKSNDSFVQQLVENALFPPNLPVASENSGIALTTDYTTLGRNSNITGVNMAGDSAQFYKPQGYKNGTRIFSAVRSVYGTYRVTPDVAAEPYTTGVGDDEELFMVFDFGYGEVQLSDIRIGDTPIGAYGNIDYKVWYNYTNAKLTYYRNTRNTEGQNVEIFDEYRYFAIPTEDAFACSVNIHFPEGLYDIHHPTLNDGRHTRWRRLLWVQWRMDGGSWNSLASAYRVRYSHQGVHAGGGPVITINGSTVQIYNYLPNPFTWWLYIQPYKDKSGEVEIRIGSPEYPWFYSNTEDRWKNMYDVTIVTQTAGVSYRRPLDFKCHPHTILELRAGGAGQLDNIIDDLSAIGKRILPTWTGSKWSNTHTRNPAWIALDILRGGANPFPVPDERIDLTSFYNWASYCSQTAAQGDTRFTVDANMDSMSTVHERMLSVMQSARASITMRGGKYAVIWENWPTVPSQVFTPINSWGFSASRTWSRKVDGLLVQWVNPDLGYQQSEYVVFNDGKNSSNAQFFEKISCPYCTRWNQAYRDARYHMAVGELRPEVFQLTTDIESLVCERGDLIRLAHDVPKIGGTATRIVKIITEDEVGPNLVIDGQFDVEDSDHWIKQTNWEISGGRATCDGTQTIADISLYQLHDDVAPGVYEFSFEILTTSGLGQGVRGILGDNYPTDWVNSIGVHKFRIEVLDETVQRIGIETDVDYAGGIDNISVSEIIYQHDGNDAIVTREPIGFESDWELMIRNDDGSMEFFNFDSQVDPFTVTVDPNPTKSKAGDLLVYGKRGLLYDDFLVKSITPGEQLTAVLTLVPYSPEIQNADTGQIPDYIPPISEEEFIPTCEDIQPVEVETYFEFIDRQPYSTVITRWGMNPYAAYYEVWLSYDEGDSWTLNAKVTVPEAVVWERLPTYNAAYPKTDIWLVVVPVSNFGQKPSLTDCTPEIFAPPHDTVKPGKPIFFAGNITGSTMHLTWLPPNAPDISGYVIRFSPLLENVSWDNATTEVDLVPHDIYFADVNARVGTYMIKTLDTSENYSINPALVKTNIPSIEDMNFVLEEEQSPLFEGIKDLCIVDNGTLIIEQQDPAGDCLVHPMGTYYFKDTIELSSVQRVYLTAKAEVTGGFCPEREQSNPGTDYDVNIQVRISTSGPIVIADWPTMAEIDPIGVGFTGGDFGGWQRITAGFYTGRVFQFRALLTSADGTAWPIISKLSAQLDVKDRVVSASDIAIDVGGTVILFDDVGGGTFFDGVANKPSQQAFSAVPAVAVTLDNAQLGDFVTVSNVTVEGFTVLIRDGSNNSIAGQIDYLARGYGYGLAEAITPIDIENEDDIREFPEAIIRPARYIEDTENEDNVTAFNQRFRYRS